MPRGRDLWYTCEPFADLFNTYRSPWIARARVDARADRYAAAWGTMLDAAHA